MVLPSLNQIGIACGALISILGFIKYIYKPIKKFCVATIAFHKNINLVAKEIAPNGGSSFRDTLDRLSKNITILNQSNALIQGKLVAIINNKNKGIFETDVNGDYIFVNRAYCRLFSRSTEEALGKGWKLFIHPEDRVRVTQEWFDCVRENRDFVSSFKILHQDGKILTVNCNAYVIKDLAGNCLGYLGFIWLKTNNPKCADCEYINTDV